MNIMIFFYSAIMINDYAGNIEGAVSVGTR